MKVSRHFLVIVLFVFLVTGGVYYFFTQSSFFDKVSASNLSQIDTYLAKNYSLILGIDKTIEDRIRVYCDTTVATSTVEGVGIAYPCQNENPLHKVVIGWVSKDYTYMTAIKALSNEQLHWRGYPSVSVEEGDLFCKERADWGNYQNAIFGMDCTLKINSGEKLFSSVFFLQGENKNIRNFISVMNTSKISSPSQVELELLALVAKIKEPPTKYRLSSLSPFSKSDISEGGQTTASSSSVLSTEADVPPRSNSANVITKDSGSGIDATVCDAVDGNSCFPLYCLSLTAVWNYSLNKCVEPTVSTLSQGEGKKSCTDEAPVWDGSKCRALVGNIISSNECVIPVGKSSCAMDIFWSVQSPKGQVEVRRSLSESESVVLAKGQSDTLSYTFPYKKEPYIVQLYDGRELVNDGKFSTRCAEGGWDSVSGTCVHPEVASLSVTGEYYSVPGILNVTCSRASAYSVRYVDTNTFIATGTYSQVAQVPITKTGNYSVICKEGDFEGSPVARYYNAPPAPTPEISFLISPRTVSKDEKTILNWSIRFPQPSCTLSAKVICKNNSCTTAQSDFENEINQILQSEFTDQNDPDGVRPIPTAVNTIPPSHIDNDWKSIGQKTLSLSYTTDFILSCGTVQDKKRVYLRTQN